MNEHLIRVENLSKVYGMGEIAVYALNGVELSIGQWQMIALARAFIRKSPLIVLDEPTSSLDPKQIIEIRTLIRELGRERTLIVLDSTPTVPRQDA